MTNWDQRYQNEAYLYGTAPNSFLVSVAEAIPPGPVLCLAAGEGRNAVYLAQRGHAVTAVDSSAVGLAKAQRLAQERQVTVQTVVADLADYQIATGAWQAITAIFCHLPPELRRSVHQRVVAGLAPGGLFILEAYTPRQLTLCTGGPPCAELLMTLDELREELVGLHMEIGQELERELHEGRLHSGRGAVVQVLARKL
jgi:SAM-dependent methyltransferase